MTTTQLLPTRTSSRVSPRQWSTERCHHQNEHASDKHRCGVNTFHDCSSIGKYRAVDPSVAVSPPHTNTHRHQNKNDPDLSTARANTKGSLRAARAFPTLRVNRLRKVAFCESPTRAGLEIFFKLRRSLLRPEFHRNDNSPRPELTGMRAVPRVMC